MMKQLFLSLCFSVLVCPGCKGNQQQEDIAKPDFSDYYAVAPDHTEKSISHEWSLPHLTISAQDITVNALIKLIAEDGNVSIICDEGLEDRKVSFSVNEIRADRVLATLARRLGCSISREGNLFYLGTIRPEDRATYITKVKRLDASSAKQAVEVMLSKEGKAVAFPDGLIIIADKIEMIGRIASLLDDIKDSPADTWVLQFQIISIRADNLKSIGLTAGANFGMATQSALAANNGDANTSNDISANLSLAIEKGYAKLIAQPMIILEDGTSARLTDGEEIPIPQKTVSQYGVVTTTGVEYRESGIEIDAYLRDMGNEKARIKCKLAIDATVGFIDGYPIIKGQKADFTSTIKSSAPYLACSLSQSFDSESKEAGVNLDLSSTTSKAQTTLGKSSEQSNGILQVWVRAYRIGALKNE